MDRENFEAAMLAYTYHAQSVGKPYLCAWNPWQRFGSMIKSAYPDTQPATEWSSVITAMSQALRSSVRTSLG